jgi:hypothetical protein
MREHARRSRRERDGRDASEAVPEHALLALQRAAGNRAVQRLVYNAKTGNVTAPFEYANLRFPWDRTADDSWSGPKDNVPDRTLAELSQYSFKAREHMQTGLDVVWVNRIDPMAADAIRQRFANAQDQELGARLADAAASHDRLVKLGPGSITDANFGERVPLVLSPKDFFPDASDLPDADVDLADEAGNKDPAYWESACALIAIYQDLGIEPIRTVTERPATPDSLTAAVNALHRHFKGQGIDWDDTSSRFQVMNPFDYKLIFSGNVTWRELGNQGVFLNAGERYIVDIEGHTVMVTMKHTVGPYAPMLQNLGDMFTLHSDPANWSPAGSEFDEKVLYVWKAP